MRRWIPVSGIFIFMFLTLAVFLLYIFLEGKNPFAEIKKDKKNYADVKIILVQPSLDDVPLLVAQEKGFFQGQGLHVTFRTEWDQDTASKALADRECDLLCAGPEVGLYNFPKGGKYGTVMLAQLCGAQGHLLVVRATEKPFSWQDLRGKAVVGRRDGELPEIIFEKLLKTNRLKPFLDVNIICNLSSRLATGAFSAGTAQAVLAPEPYCSRLENESGKYAVVSVITAPNDLLSCVLMASAAYTAERSEVCKSMFAALTQSLKWLEASTPEEIAPLLANYFPDDEKTLLQAVNRYKALGCWPASPVIDPDALERLQDLLVEEKELLKKIPAEKLIIK